MIPAMCANGYSGRRGLHQRGPTPRENPFPLRTGPVREEGMAMAGRRQWIALILSGVFPGLGQFYLQAWGKGAAFLIGGVVAMWALGELISIQDLITGLLPHPLAILGLLLALLAVFLWSIADAWISAR